MCIVTSTIMAATTMLTAVASTAIGIKSASDTSKIQEFQAMQDIEQAKIAERNAIYERQEGIESARQRRLDAIQKVGTQQAIISSGNIMTSSATALNLFNDETLSGEIDALNLIDASEQKAEKYVESAQKLYANAGLKNFKLSSLQKIGLGSDFVGLGKFVAQEYKL